MSKVRNILFVMCDQLRADFLGCTGHPTIRTPNIDKLAARGVTFTRAYCQAAICGPSRMSFYTGRYVASHGATWNRVPLRADEWTLGDYLRPHGFRVALVGKSHMAADPAGYRRLGIDVEGPSGRLIAEGGFEPYERDDGVHRGANADPDLAYNVHLRSLGYASGNPWLEYANSAEGPGGAVLSGLRFRNAPYPARVADEHSETAYMTDRAIRFIDEAGGGNWCLHLSYIKPHWPYMAAAPYHDMYRDAPVPAANRSAEERRNPHPVVDAFRGVSDSLAFQADEAREAVIPTYMGLVSQVDRHLGRLFEHLDAKGILEETLIVFTSDHGDYLGDHWLGDKDLFYEEAARIPMIVVDPDERAAGTRGTRSDALVEAIDLIPTFLDCLGAANDESRLEGRSLLPLLRGGDDFPFRDAAICEMDYAFIPLQEQLGVSVADARGTMVRTGRYKYCEYPEFPPQLFDLREDPGELVDLGADPASRTIRREHTDLLLEWRQSLRNRVTVADGEIAALKERRAKSGREKLGW